MLRHVKFQKDSDAAVYRTLQYGYDNAKSALAAPKKVASESKVPAKNVAVLRFIDETECEKLPD